MLPCFSKDSLENISAKIYFYENGVEVGQRRVFSPDALLGMTLFLPRSLGIAAAHVTLTADGGAPLLMQPLSLLEWEGDHEAWGVLLDSIPPFAMPLCHMHILLECPPFRL